MKNTFVVNNGIRVQGNDVSLKRGRWIINVVLVLAVLAFVGFSMIPLLSSAFKNEQSSVGNSPAPTAASRQAELEAQSRGYELVLQREPENQTALKGLIDARLQLSDIRFKAGDQENARNDVKSTLEPLGKLAKLNPNETRYSVLLAQAKQFLGDREGAAQVYRTILTTKPGELIALQGLVGLLLEQKRPEAAVGLLQDTLKTAPQANQIQPNSVDVTSVQMLLGQVYADQNRYDEAIAIYDEAIKGNKQDFRPVLAKALVLKTQGKTAEAQPLFTNAAALAPAQYRDQINQLASVASPKPTTNPATPQPGANQGQTGQPVTTPSPGSSSSPSTNSNQNPPTVPAAPNAN